MKKFLLFLTLFLSAVGLAQAAEVTLPASGKTWESYTWTNPSNNYTCNNLEGYTLFLLGKGTQAAPATDLRINQGGKLTITAPTGKKFNKVTITVASDSKATGATTSETSTWSVDGVVKTGENSTFSFVAKSGQSTITFWGTDRSTAKQLRIKSVTITEVEDLAADDCGLKFAAETANVTFGTTPYTLPSLTNPKGVTVKWSSSDETVAKFDAENNIEILKAGTTIIKAELADEGTAYTKNTSASYTLTVAKGTPNFAYASATYDYVMQAGGAGFSAPALNKPDGLAVTYVSSNTEVATVDENTGVITPVTRGKAVITATGAENDCWNGATATLTVNITKNIPVLTFSNTEVTKYIDELSAYKGETLTTDPADLEINYSVSPAEIASIDSKSGELTFTGATGVATITAVSTETATHESKSATYTVSVSKRNPALAFDETAVELLTTDTYAGQEVKYTLLEGLAEGFTINYETNNSSVANVNALTGAVTLTGAEGTATITAYGSGNTYYTDGSATYTIKVAKQYIWSDTKAVLVKDVNALQPGDVIIIANQSYKKAFATTESKNNNGAKSPTDITLSSDNKEIATISESVMLFEIGISNNFYTFKTLNYLGTNGYIGNSGSDNGCYVDATVSARNRATVEIASETGVATIIFNEGATSQKTYLKYNASSPGYFNCYAKGNQKSVYIYRLETPTTIVDEAPTEATYADSKVTMSNLVEVNSEATATKYAVLINGVEAGVFTVTDGTSLVDIKLSGVPYLPEAKYTICPVLAEDAEGNPTTLGHPEELTFTFPTLPVVDFSANNSVLYFDAVKYATAETCNLDAWTYLTVNFKETAGSGDYLDEKDVRRNLALNFEEFGKNEKQLIGWYDENKDQVQWCQYNFMENVTVKDGNPQITLGAVKPIGELTLHAYFTFNVAPEYASLIATPGSLSAPARVAEGSVVQKVAGNKITVTGLSWPKNEDALVSGVESVVVEGVDGAVEYYNMQGVRVEGELAPGMYIRRQGRSVSKVQIR